MNKAQKLSAIDRALAVAITALTDLACFEDGTKVTGAFDDPNGAKLARAALAQIQTILAGGAT